MTHLIIEIVLPVDESKQELTQYEIQSATKDAYRAARKALLHFTAYNENDVSYKIEK